jgi:S1-C subfamily serine protease
MFRFLLVLCLAIVPQPISTHTTSAHAIDRASNSSVENIHNPTAKEYERIMQAVVTVRNDERGGYGSGTLFTYNGQLLVLTASHVVTGLKYTTVTHGGSFALGSIVYDNPESDIAVLIVPEISDRKPLKLKFKNKQLKMGDTLSYCGFPNSRDLSCFSGEVSRMSEDIIHIHSYAWMGASGSSVFDSSGNVVGVLSAIEVGTVWGGPQLIDNVVWAGALTEKEIEKIQLALDKI